MAYRVGWAGPNGMHSETVATAKVALTKYLQLLDEELSWTEVRNEAGIKLSSDDLAHLAALEQMDA